MTFICYPKCTTCQKAQKWLDENGISYTFRDIKMENPTYNELTAWHERSGLPLKRFFNTSGLLYKSMGLKDKLPQMSVFCGLQFCVIGVQLDMRSIGEQVIQALLYRCHIFFSTIHPQVSIRCPFRIYRAVYFFRNDQISVRAYKGACDFSMIGIGSASVIKVECNRCTRRIPVSFHPRGPAKENIPVFDSLCIVHGTDIAIPAHHFKILLIYDCNRKFCSVQICRDDFSRQYIRYTGDGFDFFNQRIIQWVVL